MSDRELLEDAAKAAGMDIEWQPYGWAHDNNTGCEWNPLTDDGDALRLAVTLHINIEMWNTDKFVRANVVIGGRHFSPSERYTDDPYAATRRAIVRSAAEIGRSKE